MHLYNEVEMLVLRLFLVGVYNELLNFLKEKDEELNALNITRDRFDDFGAFVASELRNKDPTEVFAFMQQICAVLYSRIDYA